MLLLPDCKIFAEIYSVLGSYFVVSAVERKKQTVGKHHGHIPDLRKRKTAVGTFQTIFVLEQTAFSEKLLAVAGRKAR